MAQNTEHYNLVKPDYTDAADVAQLNENMDIIDRILWQLANAGGDEEILNLLRQIIALIGETADTGGSTTLGSVMAKLNEILKKAGSGTTGKTIIQILEELLQQPKIIKHIQRGFVTTNSANGASGTVTLAGFTNLEKMVAILNGSVFLGSGTYSGIYLKELTLTSLSTLKAQGGSYSYQVIEFC